MIVPKLLITDDDSSIRRTLEEVFIGRGLQVATAGDGDEAIALIQREPIHLLLVDVHMPRVSGLEVIRHLRDAGQVLPFVVMSAAMTDSIEREAESMGAYRVLTKPIRLATIRETVLQGLWDVYGWTLKSA